MDFTFLRDNLYLDFMPDLAGEDGVIRTPVTGPADGPWCRLRTRASA